MIVAKQVDPMVSILDARGDSCNFEFDQSKSYFPDDTTDKTVLLCADGQHYMYMRPVDATTEAMAVGLHDISAGAGRPAGRATTRAMGSARAPGIATRRATGRAARRTTGRATDVATGRPRFRPTCRGIGRARGRTAGRTAGRLPLASQRGVPIQDVLEALLRTSPSFPI